MSENSQNFDPGTGTSFSQKTKRIINKDGSFNVSRVGSKFTRNDFYLFFIKMPWFNFLLVLTIGFFLINFLFALAYWSMGDNHLGTTESLTPFDHFLHCYYFSTQTFTTVGYGAVAPTSNSSSMLAAFEAFFGFLSFSLATGLLFGRFSRPNARIRYSKNALLTEVKGMRAIVFRVANERSTPLLDLRATLIATLTHEDPNHGISRVYKRLDLQVNSLDFMPLNWTIVHFINNDSPLAQYSDEELVNRNGELLIHLKGFDEAFSQEVHSKFSYLFSEIVLNASFERAFKTDDSGEVKLDLEKIDSYKKL